MERLGGSTIGAGRKGGRRAASDGGHTSMDAGHTFTVADVNAMSRNGGDVLLLEPHMQETERASAYSCARSAAASPIPNPSPCPSPSPVPEPAVAERSQVELELGASDSTLHGDSHPPSRVASPAQEPEQEPVHGHEHEHDLPRTRTISRAPTFVTFESEDSQDRTPPMPLPCYTRPVPKIPFAKAS